MVNPHEITKVFEKMLSDYTGAPYVVAVDNQSNAMYLALLYQKQRYKYTIPLDIPKHTYPSVPCEIIRAGYSVRFKDSDPILTGEYQLGKSMVWDSALRFTANMYRKNQIQCLSFTGPYKHLKLTKGGAILTDSEDAYKWLKKARFSGRSECSYHVDNFDENPVIGMNAYMIPEISARGVQMMGQFYNQDGTPKENADLSLPYPDLSKFNLWK